MSTTQSYVHGGDLERASVAEGQLVALFKQLESYSGSYGLTTLDRHNHLADIPYDMLFKDAVSLCAGMQESGLKAGDRLLLQLDDAADMIPVFWGAILAGVVPVPLNPALSYEAMNSQVRKLLDVWKAFDQPVVLTSGNKKSLIEGCSRFSSDFTPRVLTCTDLRSSKAVPDFHTPASTDVAVYFLTSGSTGIPKGVPQTHASILAMIDGTIQMNGFTEDDVTLNWMSLDHAGSLVFLGVMSVALKCRQVHVPIDYILQQPLRWLDLIEETQGSISWAPNFVFSLLLEKEQEIADSERDLSSMRFMVNAGEAVVAKTARSFIRLLSRHGLPADALRPAFGMVETCSGITWSPGFTLDNSSDNDSFVDLGTSIPGAEMRVINDVGEVVPEGESGRFQLKGPSVFQGYYGRSDLNDDLFDDEWMTTGDLAYIQDGHLFITGREKDVIIIHGNNFYCHDIESAVEELDGVVRGSVAACGVRSGETSTEQLAVFYSLRDSATIDLDDLNRHIRVAIMESVGISPTWFIELKEVEFPRTEIGKIQRSKLVTRFEAGEFDNRRKGGSTRSGRRRRGKQRGLLASITDIWADVLGMDAPDPDLTFFEMGGDSLRAIQVQQMLEELVGRPVTMVELFNMPTIRIMADCFEEEQQGATSHVVNKSAASSSSDGSRDVAIIGVACRFPGAEGPHAFWENLANGVESIEFYGRDAAVEAGMDPVEADHPDHVHAAPILDDIEGFDSQFWRYSSREARMIDPQQRIFLETAWEAFEDAGYVPGEQDARTGVFAAAGTNTYILNNLFANASWVRDENGGRTMTVDSMNGFNVMITNDKDYLPTRVSYKLNLKGPSINVQTACSSTLLAVHEACKSLRAGETDMALAGGCAAMLPQYAGHRYSDGMIMTPDGHCRAYDAEAAGTIFGSGSGALLLKRLADAERDGDHIYAVVRGSASCNDGGDKMGYTAPSMEGEYNAIRGALNDAGVTADSLSYVEGHGTGTPLGDPIEVEALTRAFREDTDGNQFCALGSVKTNIGHMGIGSGIAGIIKTVLALKHRAIPATLHFQNPNPRIDFESSPFFVNTERLDLSERTEPLRAGVNSLGIGGANVHVILEEAPQRKAVASERAHDVLPLSSQSPAALSALAERMASFLQSHPEVSEQDAAYTCRYGRKHFDCRKAFTYSSRDDLIKQLNDFASDAHVSQAMSAPVFMFSGQGAQFSGMARELYDGQDTFREMLDACCALFKDEGIDDVKAVLLGDHPEADTIIHQTAITQPAVFTLQVSLASYYDELGLEPEVLVGHSIGEIAAAWYAGVFSLEDAIKLVAARGRLMQALPEGGVMAAVHASREVVASHCHGVAVAAVNGPANTVISGAAESVDAALSDCEKAGITISRLRVSHAFHSELMDDMLTDFKTVLETLDLNAPEVAIHSTLTGTLAGVEMSTPDYWVRHARESVQFKPVIESLCKDGFRTFVELGPGTALCGLVRSIAEDHDVRTLPSVRYQKDCEAVQSHLLAGLYESGVSLTWQAALPASRRVSLPTYPWQRSRHWVEPDPNEQESAAALADPLLGRLMQLPLSKQRVYQSEFSLQHLPVLSEHLVFDRIVPPGALYASQLLRAACDSFDSDQVGVQGLTFMAPMVLKDNGHRSVQLVLDKSGDDFEAEIVSFTTNLQGEASGVVRHAHARLSRLTGSPLSNFQSLKRRCTKEIDAGSVHAQMTKMGIGLGDSFTLISRLWTGKHSAFAELSLPESISLDKEGYFPGLIDGHWQTFLAATGNLGDLSMVPFEIDELVMHAKPDGDQLFCFAEWEPSTADDDHRRGNVFLFNGQGKLLLETRGFVLRRIDASTIQSVIDADIDDSLYSLEWEPLVDEHIKSESGRVLLAVSNGMGKSLASELNKRGQQVQIVDPVSDKDSFQEIIRQATAETMAPLTLAYAPYANSRDTSEYCMEMRDMVLSANAEGQALTTMVLLTAGSQRLSDDEAEPVDTAGAMAWAQAGAVAKEYQQMHVSCVDVDEWGSSLSLVADVIGGAWSDESRLAVRKGKMHALRLKPAQTETAIDPITFSPDHVQLITGGLGGLGLLTAEWMVQHGARKLVLAGRSQPGAEAQQAIDALKQKGAEIIVVACDVGVRDDVASLFETATALGVIEFCIHAAGVRKDGMLSTLSAEDYRNVLAPKADGARFIEELSKTYPIKKIIFFSSAASLFGSAGQTNYAAANGALDAAADRLRSRGVHAVSVNWGPWSAVGMAAELDERFQKMLASQGYREISPDAGFKALGAVMRGWHESRAVFVPSDREQMGRHNGSSSLWKRLITAGTETAVAKAQPALIAALQSAPDDQHFSIVESYLIDVVADMIDGSQVKDIDSDKGLYDLGVDSLASIEIKSRLERDSGLRLRSTLALDYPTIRLMADYLKELLCESEMKTDAVSQNVESVSSDTHTELDDLSSDDLVALLEQELN